MAKQVIKYSTLKKYVEQEVGIPLNTDLFWGKGEIVVFPPKKERIYHRLIINLRRKSSKYKPHAKDRGNTINTGDVRFLIHHLQRKKVLPLGTITVIEG